MSYENKIITRKKKLKLFVKKINHLSNEKQIEIYDKIIALIKKNVQTEIKHLSKKNINDLIYERIFDDICKLGNPFYKHKKGKTKIYLKSIFFIKKYHKKYRGNLLDIFKLGQEYFNSSGFIFKPEGGKISIPDFFEYDIQTLTYSPYLSKYTKSWFNEFAKGREHIENKFVRKTKEYNQELTNLFIDIWEQSKQQKITGFDKKHAIIFVNKTIIFARNNSLSVRTIFDVVKNELSNNNNIQNTKYLTSDYFLNNAIPKGLIKIGVFKNIREIVIKNDESKLTIEI